MKLSEMKQLLVERQIRLTKSLGQNFLHDGNQLRRIVDAAELKKSDKVFEIGPGLGPLTELLVAEAGEVLAIDKDARLVELVRELSGKRPGGILQVLNGDALDFVKNEPRDWTEWKLVANLPYSIGSPILVEMALAERGPARMVVTLQLEVARRLTAGPGEADYGVLTLLVQLSYRATNSFKIPASCFFPEPGVDSACVCLVRRDQAMLSSSQRPFFVRIIKRSFSQRRKMMLKLLKEDWPMEELGKAFKELPLAPGTRAEKVSLEQFVKLTELLTKE